MIDEGKPSLDDHMTQTQTSNSVEISLPAIRFTLLSPQLLAAGFADPCCSCPLRMLSISLLIRLAQAMAACCSVLVVLRLLLVVLLLPCSVMIVLLSVSCVSLFVLLVLMIFERVWLLWFNTVVVVVVVIVVVVPLLLLLLMLPAVLMLLVRLLALNRVLGITGGFMGRSLRSLGFQYNTIEYEGRSTTNHNMKVNKIQNKKRKE